MQKSDYPENDAIDNGSRNSVNDDGSRDYEHLCAGPGNKALCLEFQGGGHHCVGKAGYRHKCSRSADFGYIIVYAKAREQSSKKNKAYAGRRRSRLVSNTEIGVNIKEKLPEATNSTADCEGFYNIRNYF